MPHLTTDHQRVTYADGAWADVSSARFPAGRLRFQDITQPDGPRRTRDAARLRYYKARIRGEADPLIIAWAALESDGSAPHMFPTLNTITDEGEHLLSTNALITYTLRGLVQRGWLRRENSTWRTDIPPGYADWQARAEVLLGWLNAEGRLWLESGPDSPPPDRADFAALDPLLHLTPVGRCGHIRDVAQQQMPAAAFNSAFFLLEHNDYLSHHSALGDPYGLLVSGGVIHRPPLYRRSTLWQDTAGRWHTGQIGMGDVRLLLPDGSALHPAGHAGPNDLAFVVNPPPGDSAPIAVYTRYFGVAEDDLAHGFTPTAPGRFELTVIDRRVTGWKRGGGLQIPQNGFVLSMEAARDGQPLTEIGALAGGLHALQSLLQGGTVGYAFAEPDHQGMREAVQVGPQLLREGEIVLADNTFTAEEFWPGRMGEDRCYFGVVPTDYPTDVARTRAARIGVGVDAAGDLIALAISGASQGIARAGIDSAGATLVELAAQLQAAGAVEAVNLDGGGSTQLFVEGGLMTIPGDRRGRQGVMYERMVPTIGIVR